VRADERRLTQILINLLGNAVKFTAQGRVRFSASHVREMAVFEIEDTGPGIASDELEAIFEPFARAAASAGTGGTGLGLTIAKMLTELMGGDLAVRSSPGQGTLFRVKLFLPALPHEAAQTLPKPRLAYAGERRRLLVVDNEEVDRTLLAARLQSLGFDVVEASSGTAALAWLTEHAAGGPAGRGADAILMDLAMPGIDGWTTIRRLRELGLSRAPVAIVSANAFDKGADNDVGIMADDFITKPVRLDELQDWLGHRLGLHWLETAPVSPPEPVAPTPLATTPQGPPSSALLALREVVRLGYPRGVQRSLDDIEQRYPDSQAFVASLRPLARQFQFERLMQVINDALERSSTP
jgi:CheY-like chemotaxis protein/anti-sigma regulatory factor (Ser/Thr protein kinase)